MSATPYDVFISYARRDQASADRLDQTLRHDGYATWIDRRRLQGGQVWERELQQAIDGARALILLLSPAAVASLNVQAEFNYALDEGIRVLAVIIEPCDIPERLHAEERVSIITPPTPPALSLLIEKELAKTSIAPSRHNAVRRNRLVLRGSILGAVAAVIALIITINTLLSAKTPLPPYQVPGVSVISYSNRNASALVAGPDNAMWYLSGGVDTSNAVGRMTQDGHVTEYRLPDSNARPTQLTQGPDGNLWFLDEENERLARVTPQGQITEFTNTSFGGAKTEELEALVAGPDGNLWLLESNSASLLGIAPSGALVRTLPLNLLDPFFEGAMVLGRTGDFWVGGSDGKSNVLFRITSSGTTQTITRSDGFLPDGIVAASDGGVWVAYLGGADPLSAHMVLAHIGPTGAVIKQMNVPQPNTSEVYPTGTPMTLGPDGALWFSQGTDFNQPFNLLRYDIAQDSFTRVLAPQSGMGRNPPDLIAAGPDGRLWGAGYHDDKTPRYWIQPLVSVIP